MATAKQRAWRAEFGRRYGKKHGSKKARGAKRPRRSRGVGMARHHRRKSGGGFGVGGLLSTKNILGTVAGAYIAPKFGLNAQLGAAAGSYLVGKKGVMGAAVGYFAAPYVLGMLGGMTGGSSTADNGAW